MLRSPTILTMRRRVQGDNLREDILGKRLVNENERKRTLERVERYFCVIFL